MMPNFPAEKAVPLEEVERELARQLDEIEALDELFARRVRMSNLVIFCDRADRAAAVATEVAAITTQHPARVLLLLGEAGPGPEEVVAVVRTWPTRRGQLYLCTEQVTLTARGQAVERLPSAVRTLLVSDLPVNLWWASTVPPPLAGPLLYELAERAQQVLYDSLAWAEPARGVAAAAAWFAKCERDPGEGPWRVVSDLNWRRLKYWRRLLAQELNPASAPDALASVREVELEHGPHAVVQAWELVSWLAARLGWRVEEGRVAGGVEIAWQFHAPHGEVRVRIRRLPEGPAALRSLRWTCASGVWTFTADDDRRLSAVPDTQPAAPRTITVQPQPLAELVGRQLSDRERDPVFRESMAVAGVLARSLLE